MTRRKLKKRGRNKLLDYLLIALEVVLVVLVFVILLRVFSSREVDDVSPGIECSEDLLKKADVLWVIPDFNGNNISNNSEWCNYIKSFNKTIGMHGVRHSYEEFGVLKDRQYLDEGVREFEQCFGFRPSRFKAPQLTISGDNLELIKIEGMELTGKSDFVTHRVYHCSDGGVLPNWLADLF